MWLCEAPPNANNAFHKHTMVVVFFSNIVLLDSTNQTLHNGVRTEWDMKLYSKGDEIFWTEFGCEYV